MKAAKGLHVGATIAVPRSEWQSFLNSFSHQHHNWLVSLVTFDLETEETVATPYLPLQRIELDVEDSNNPRINVIVQMDNKVIKHILFRPATVILHLGAGGAREALEVHSINTHTMIRFRVVIDSELVDELV